MIKKLTIFISAIFLLLSLSTLQAQRLQAVHCISDPGLSVVDVYIQASIITIKLEDAGFRTAYPMTTIPFVGIPLKLGIAPGNSTSINDTVRSFGATLQAGLTYAALFSGVQDPSLYAPNPDGRGTRLNFTLTNAAREASTVPGSVQFSFYHGVTDAPTVDLAVRNGATLVDNAVYRDLSAYNTMTPGQYIFDIKNQAGQIIAAYDVDFAAYADSAMIFFYSGFLDPAVNQNGAAAGLFAALPGGEVIAFPEVIPNQPPFVAAPVANQTRDEDFSAYTVADLTTVFSDPDTPVLNYSVSSDGNTVPSLNGNNLELASVPDFFGQSEVVVSAGDGEYTISDTFLVTVNPVNDPPVLAGIPDVTFDEDEQFDLDLDAFVNDVDNSAAEIGFGAEVIAASVPQQFGGGASGIEVDVDDLIITIDPLTHVANFSSTADSSGLFTVVFTATDPGSAADTDTISVTVLPANDPPLLANPIADASILEDSGENVLVADLYTVFSDVDNDVLTFSAVAGAGLSAAATGDALRVTPDPDFFGDVEVVVTADDGMANVSDTLTVTVENVNDAPTPAMLLAPVDGFMLDDPTLPLEFRWQASVDVDGDVLSYEWRVVSEFQDTTVAGLSDTSFTFDGSAFWQINTTYHWMVNTGDGTVMVASADTFALIVPLINSLDDQPGSLPSEFVLEQNYPNPFNPVTFIRFALPEALPVRVEVFNMLGQPVATLVNEMKPAGYHTVSFDGSELSSGIYFYRLEAGSFSQLRKMILMK